MAASSRKGGPKFANELLVNLFHAGDSRRFYMIVQNQQKMIYLLLQRKSTSHKKHSSHHSPANELINTKAFDIRTHSRIMMSNAAHIVAITVNEDFTKMLMTCSDRVLILYRIDFDTAGVFEELDKFADVINKKRWINTAFVRLEETTRIVNDNGVGLAVDRAEPFTTDCIGLVGQSHNYANSSCEIFLGSSGENGANEIKFFNSEDCSG